MTSVVTFKFLITENGKATGDIRRVTLKAPATLETLQAAAKDILGWPDVIFRYQDDDGDVVTVASQHELDTAIALSKNGPVRLSVARPEPRAVVEEVKKPEEKPAPAPAPAPAAAPVAEAAAAAPVPEAAAPVDFLDAAPSATIPENVMVQFSAIAEFFQRMAQQMAEFAPRIPVIVNEGIRKMSTSMQNNFNPLDVSVAAARAAPAGAEPEVPKESYNVVVHRLPESVVHPGVECAHCHKKPIAGMRYKCVQCDCDLCQDCVFIPNVHTEGHRFLPICAPAVGSHFVNSASEACETVKARAAPVVEQVKARAAPVVDQVMASAAPVVQSVVNAAAPVMDNVKGAVDGAVSVAVAKGAEISDMVKKQVEAMKEPEKKQQQQQPVAPESLTPKEVEILKQLNDMGFNNQEELLPLIKKHGDLSRIIEHLIQ